MSSGSVKLAEPPGPRVRPVSAGTARRPPFLQTLLTNQAGSADLPTNFLFTVHQSISCDK